MRYTRRSKCVFLAFLCCFASLMIYAGTAKSLPQTPASPPQEDQSKYAGSTPCATCHEELYQRFTKSPHQILETHPKKGWQQKSCEACHGPGQAHVETGDATKILSFNKIPVSEVTAKCLNCHGQMQDHAGFGTGLHGRNQVGCIDCHKVHEPRQPLRLAAENSDQLCVRCHREIQPSFSKPFRHKLREGAIHCVDCHQPHGGLNPRQVRLANGNEAACLKCHTDIRGPFTFEHLPVRLEGCTACHEPHGSNNPKLLTRNKVYLLCLECHTGTTGLLADQPPSFHDLRSPRFQNCTTCHTRIHGSNVSSHLLR